MLSTVENAMKVIEFLAEKNEAGLSAIGRYLRLAPSTTHRLVSTLASRDFIVRDMESRKYRLGMKFFQLGISVANRFGVRNAAVHSMEELAAKTGETVNLGILVNGKVYYLEKISNDEPIRVELQVGRAVPAHCTAMGKVILAFLSPGKRGEILSRMPLERRTVNTLADRAALGRQLRDIRANGFAVDNGELLEGVCCVAAPVLGLNGEAIAAISVAGPSFRVTGEFIRRHTPDVIRAAEKTSRDLQGLGVNVVTM
jgi:DNA-binding IclR family transcriptional regulator